MYENLKQEALEANLLLPAYNLVKFTWGNVSIIDRKKQVIAIKPSGIAYENMKLDDIVIVDLNGSIIEGNLRPSSDLNTHLECYKNWSTISSVVHTHSPWATTWAQAGLDIPALGTTHADYFYGRVPCTAPMSKQQIEGEYETETGRHIVSTFNELKINPDYMPGILVHCHGVFCWGSSGIKAVQNAVVIEECAMMAYQTKLLNPHITKMQPELLDRHFLRKHGANAYYGQMGL